MCTRMGLAPKKVFLEQIFRCHTEKLLRLINIVLDDPGSLSALELFDSYSLLDTEVQVYMCHVIS